MVFYDEPLWLNDKKWMVTAFARDTKSGIYAIAYNDFSISLFPEDVFSRWEEHVLDQKLLKPFESRRLTQLRHHLGTITSLSFCPVLYTSLSDRPLLASASDDKSILLWQRQSQAIQSHDEKSRENDGLTEHWKVTSLLINSSGGGAPTCLAWAPSGRLLASGYSDCTITLWYTNFDGKMVNIGTRLALLAGHKSVVKTITFHPHEHFFLTCDRYEVRFWSYDYQSEVKLLATNEVDFHSEFKNQGVKISEPSNEGTDSTKASANVNDKSWGEREEALDGNDDPVNLDSNLPELIDENVDEEEEIFFLMNISASFSPDGAFFVVPCCIDKDQMEPILKIFKTDALTVHVSSPEKFSEAVASPENFLVFPRQSYIYNACFTTNLYLTRLVCSADAKLDDLIQSYVALVGEERRISIWSTSPHRKLMEFKGLKDHVRQLGWTDDGKLLVLQYNGKMGFISFSNNQLGFKLSGEALEAIRHNKNQK